MHNQQDPTPVTCLDITLPNGKTTRAVVYSDGSVSQGSLVWTPEQFVAGKAKLIAVGAKIVETAI